jgi:syntaxin 18
MTDLTPVLNDLLKSHDARPTVDPSLSLKNIDEFLKEAYRIVSGIRTSDPRLAANLSLLLQNSHIASLNRYLKGIRQAYLSTAPPPRRSYSASKSASPQPTHLTDRQKEEIDAETKQLLRELNASIRNLADAEQLRQSTEATLTRKKYARLGLGALGAWAAGGGGAGPPKTPEQEHEEARAGAVSVHRESVLWFLRQRLQACGSVQAAMMEKRIMREVEKNRSVLAKSRGGAAVVPGDAHPAPAQYPGPGAPLPETTQQQYHPEEELTPEQIQMFERENQDMLKHYETTLDQVRYVLPTPSSPQSSFHTPALLLPSFTFPKTSPEPPRNPSSRSPPCKRSSSRTSPLNPRTSTSWSRTRSSLPRTWAGATSSSRKPPSGRVRRGTCSTRRAG